MIIDIDNDEWIVRFKGKKITFKDSHDFIKLIEKIENSGQATLMFELKNIQDIDPVALGGFLQLFLFVDPARHQVDMLNASKVVQKKLVDLANLVDARQKFQTFAMQDKGLDRQLFSKVLRARTLQNFRKNAREEQAKPDESLVDALTDSKQTMLLSCLKFIDSNRLRQKDSV